MYERICSILKLIYYVIDITDELKSRLHFPKKKKKKRI